MCILEQEPFGDLIPLGTYYDEYCIDDFMNGKGECKFYKDNESEELK